MKKAKTTYHWGPDADFLVIGSGVAGLRAAIELSQHGHVLIITKGSRRQSNSAYAQGGVAVALSGEDDVNLHFSDTIKAGHQLGREDAARALVEEGPTRIQELIAWGTRGRDNRAGAWCVSLEWKASHFGGGCGRRFAIWDGNSRVIVIS